MVGEVAVKCVGAARFAARPARQDPHVISAPQVCLDERASDEASAAGDRDCDH
jgi:hypothetical protein